MATTVGTTFTSGHDTAPAGSTTDTASGTISSGDFLVAVGAWASNDLTLSSVVWDPAGAADSMTIRADFYGNFGNTWIATLASPTAGTGVVRATYSGTPDDTAWVIAIPLSADGALSYNAISTAAQAANTDVSSDGTGICIDSFIDTFTTGATRDTGDQTEIYTYSGDSFYSGGASYKTPGASTTNMNWVSTNTPHHVCVHIAEAAAAASGVGKLINGGLVH